MRVAVAVLIPAHNEEEHIAAAVASVRHSRVIVVADNCTDNTARVAFEAGAEVFVTANNTAKKAGALNQALAWLLPQQHDYVMVMDADSEVGAKFIYVAEKRLVEDKTCTLGAVGGVFYAKNPRRLVERLQANEYRRYSRVIAQRRDRVAVLTGTASMFRTWALKDLINTRGYAYDPGALTEDNEITLALKSRGWGLISPVKCTVQTSVPTRWRDLKSQRLRWYKGAIDNLRAYGWTPVTRRYWLQQFGLAASVLATLAYLWLMVADVAVGAVTYNVFWLLVGLGFVVERVVTVWREGWRARLLAALLIPEMMYDIYLQAIFLKALWCSATGREVRWVHPAARRVAAHRKA